MPTITGNEGAFIDITEAKTLTKAFTTQNPDGIRAGMTGKNKVLDLMNQEGAKGLRIYNGLNDGQSTFVLVAVDKNGNDMLELILDRNVMCPNICDTNSSPL